MLIKSDIFILSLLSFLNNNLAFDICNLNCREFAKTCHYTFKIRSSQLNNRTFYLINGQIPGPEISLCIFDYLIVDVINLLPRHEQLSIHWHGLNMVNASSMDGISWLTQCPIVSFESFRYEFRILQSVEQHINGIFGPIVILEHAQHYNLITLYPITNQLLQSDPKKLKLNEIRLNKKYQFLFNTHIIKIINAAAIDCPMLISFTGYFIKIFKSDGNYVKETRIKNLLIFPGERLDIRLEKNYDVIQSIWFQVKGFHLCSHLIINELIKSDLQITPPDNLLHLKIPNFNGCSSFYDSVICSQNLQNDKNLMQFSKNTNSTIYLGFKTSANENFVYPSLKHDTKICGQFRNECINILYLKPSQKIVEVVLVNLNIYPESGTTFHLHGSQAYILGSGSFATNLSLDWVQFVDTIDPFVRNFYTPPMKDTFYVPDQGFLIFRLILSIPGYWLLESRDLAKKKFQIIFAIGDNNNLVNVSQKCYQNKD